MAIIQKHSKYGIGRETTAGTSVAPGTNFVNGAGRIPQEALIKFTEGTEFEVVRKFGGTIYRLERERFSAGKMPGAEGFSHNVNVPLLNLLLASMHGLPGTQTVPPWEFYPPASGKIWTLGDATAGDRYTFSLWHELIKASGAGAGDGYVHNLFGCVCRELTLTFPLSGGPIKMAWSAAAMDSDFEEDEQALAGYADPSEASYADLDLLAQNFKFYYSDQSDATPDRIYPDGDVVFSLSPLLSVEKRGTGKPYKLAFTEYAARVSFKFPMDSTPDGALQDFYANTFKHFYITNTVDYSDAPSAAGEILIVVRGEIETEPGVEGEGILKENVEIVSRGTMAGTTPYQVQTYEAAPAAGTWNFDLA